MQKIDQSKEIGSHQMPKDKTHSGSFFWPILLITIGTLLLLNNFGILPWGIWDSLTRFWPIILILLGLEILLGRSRITNLIVTLLGLIILVTIIFVYIPTLGQQINQLISQLQINSSAIFNR